MWMGYAECRACGWVMAECRACGRVMAECRACGGMMGLLARELTPQIMSTRNDLTKILQP